MKTTYKFSFVLIALTLIALPVTFVFSEGGGNDTYDITIDNPLSGASTLPEFIEAVLKNVVIPVGAVISVLFIVYAGFLYVTAQGSEEKIKTAHRALLYAVIGTAILLGAWVISEGIAGTINQLTAPPGGGNP